MVDLLALLHEVLRIEGQRDSLTIGTAGRGGAIKVYGDFSDLLAFQAKLEAAFELRKVAQVKMAVEKAKPEGLSQRIDQVLREGSS